MSYKDKIISYLKSGRRGKQANELERNAVSDPFLHDALDGFDNADDNKILADIDELQKQVEQRSVQNKPKKQTLRWITSVAAVLLIFITGFWILNHNNNNSKQIAILSQKEEKELNEALDQYQDYAKKHDSTDESASNNDFATEDDKQLNVQEQQFNKKAIQPPPQLEIILEEDISVQSSVELSLNAETKEAVKQFEKKEVYFEKLNIAEEEEYEEAAKQQIPTNAILSAEKQISSSEYFATQSPILQNKPNTNNSERIMEQVSVGYAKRQQERQSAASKTYVKPIIPDTTLSKAQPKIGFNKYMAYIYENLDCTLNNNGDKSNKIILSFIIGENGQPNDIKVEKGVNNKCDKKAVKLVKKGGEWTTPNNPNERIILEIPLKY